VRAATRMGSDIADSAAAAEAPVRAAGVPGDDSDGDVAIVEDSDGYVTVDDGLRSSSMVGMRPSSMPGT
jgi:hypothetical protein